MNVWWLWHISQRSLWGSGGLALKYVTVEDPCFCGDEKVWENARFLNSFLHTEYNAWYMPARLGFPSQTALLFPVLVSNFINPK